MNSIRSFLLAVGCSLLAFSANAQSQGTPDFFKELATAAIDRTHAQVTYDPTYFSIAYPNGDVPANKGVCTDVVIRSYRAMGIDLQSLVHRDMKAHFSAYPKLWGLTKPDPNIDHRRVPNLMTFLKGSGASLPITEDAEAYHAGDIVAWDLGHGLKHIGVVSTQKTASGRRMIVHNIGRGPQLEDILFNYTIIGHYRFEGNESQSSDSDFSGGNF